MGRSVVDYLEARERPAELPVVAGSNVRYVIPGRANLTSDNRFYLRSFIAKVGAVVEVRLDGTVIKKLKQHHVQPSEMISIDLSGEDLDADARRLEVAIV
jgi:hypothetical protein